MSCPPAAGRDGERTPRSVLVTTQVALGAGAGPEGRVTPMRAEGVSRSLESELAGHTKREGLLLRLFPVSANFGARGVECLRLERNDALVREPDCRIEELLSSVSRCSGAERVQRS